MSTYYVILQQTPGDCLNTAISSELCVIKFE